MAIYSYPSSDVEAPINGTKVRYMVITPKNPVNMDGISFYLYRDGTIGTCVLTLRGVTNNAPNSTIYLRTTFNGNAVSTSYSNLKNYIPFSYKLEAGTSYAFHLTAPDQSSNELTIIGGTRPASGLGYEGYSNDGVAYTPVLDGIWRFDLEGTWTPTMGTKELRSGYPYVEGLIAGSTKQTGKKDL